MDVKIINSGSSGNCAVVDNVIIIDAGWNVIVDGEVVFLTHHHSDHTKHLDKMQGLPIYALPKTIEMLQKQPRFMYTAFTPLTFGEAVTIKHNGYTYYVKPVPVKHDVPCTAFDITKWGEDVGGFERIFFGTDFNTIVDEELFINELRNKSYDAIYIEANNTLNPTDFFDVYFPEEGEKTPKDAFHRSRSFQNHANVDYIASLFIRAGYSEDNKFTEPVRLLHKSSFYYSYNPERVVNLCKIAKIVNPIH